MINTSSIICNKHDITLQVNKNKKIYSLKFDINISNKFDSNQLFSFNFYNLLKTLNKDLIEDLILIDTEYENIKNILFKFNNLGKELDMSSQYMIIQTTINNNNNTVLFSSCDISLNNDEINYYKLNDYDKLFCDFANLNINIIDNKLYFNYIFKISLADILPIYIENIMGVMMKKIFYNIKQFIEKI
tara:strand:- start:8511 stop:9074 length:564 start_codon:yes stop_codon:yes gene_type:complete